MRGAAANRTTACDPETAEILEEREVVERHVQGLRAEPGTVTEDVAYTKRAVADAIQRP